MSKEAKSKELKGSEVDSSSFDPKWYLSKYPDVELTGMDPTEHYLIYGRMLGRSPNAKAISTDILNIDGRLQSLAQVNEAFSLSKKYQHSNDCTTTLTNVGPLVSVVVPNYNNGKYLSQCLNSILSQEGVNVEIIIVDDGSIDDSARIASEYTESFPNIRFISLLRNFGCYYARNVGIQNAQGDFVAFIDSDDIMHPRRLSLQLKDLMIDSSLAATRCKLRRWNEDYSCSLSDLRFGEVTLMCRRALFTQIGYFDTVRFGADSEFRQRMSRLLGSRSIRDVYAELYYARTIQSSLTMSSASGVFIKNNNKLEVKSTPSRKQYQTNFTKWHRQIVDQNCNKSLSFPLLSRPFELGSEEQNASPSLGVRRVASMATFPEREAVFKKVLLRILPQVDEIRIYFNEYDKIPSLPKSDKIKAFLGSNEIGDIKDTGKFYNLPDDDCYIFTLDDDILYPEDYVSTLIHYIEMFQRNCVIGVHGVIFPNEMSGYLDKRHVLHFKEAHKGQFVDLLGTGTLAFHSSLVRYEVGHFQTNGLCDLWSAVVAHQLRVPLFSVPRRKNWLVPLQNEGPNLYQVAKSDGGEIDTIYSEQLWPLIEGGRSRKPYASLLLEQKGWHALRGADIQTPDDYKTQHVKRIETSRGFHVYSSQLPKIDTQPDLKFHVVVTGWNCAQYVDACLSSIANQDLGSFELSVTVVDDGSTDDTLQKICSFMRLPNAQILSVDRNMGPAHARDIAIRTEVDPNSVIVLVDLDDELERHALRTVANRYRENRECLVTIGNWHNQHGKINPQAFYTDDELDEQRVRDVALFNATSLRTFRRKLYDVITPDDLKGPHGEWLETCTDVAVMYPILDQCFARNVEFISEPIYMYNQKHGLGTLARFGKPHKVERLEWLRTKARKKRFTGESSE